MIEKVVQDTLDWLNERSPEQDECDDKRGEIDHVLSRELKLKGEKKRMARLRKLSLTALDARIEIVGEALMEEMSL
eukprot:1035807-Alexandrium_andersonii.AAC.1